jgi:hypothetical protein
MGLARASSGWAAPWEERKEKAMEREGAQERGFVFLLETGLKTFKQQFEFLKAKLERKIK